MNGKPGDNPVRDICVYGLAVFSPVADALVLEIERLLGRQRLYELMDWLDPPPLPEPPPRVQVITCGPKRTRSLFSAGALDDPAGGPAEGVDGILETTR